MDDRQDDCDDVRGLKPYETAAFAAELQPQMHWLGRLVELLPLLERDA
jgi:hypothetical protein